MKTIKKLCLGALLCILPFELQACSEKTNNGGELQFVEDLYKNILGNVNSGNYTASYERNYCSTYYNGLYMLTKFSESAMDIFDVDPWTGAQDGEFELLKVEKYQTNDDRFIVHVALKYKDQEIDDSDEPMTSDNYLEIIKESGYGTDYKVNDFLYASADGTLNGFSVGTLMKDVVLSSDYGETQIPAKAMNEYINGIEINFDSKYEVEAKKMFANINMNMGNYKILNNYGSEKLCKLFDEALEYDTTGSYLYNIDVFCNEMSEYLVTNITTGDKENIVKVKLLVYEGCKEVSCNLEYIEEGGKLKINDFVYESGKVLSKDWEKFIEVENR